jgi:hypothetical protein
MRTLESGCGADQGEVATASVSETLSDPRWRLADAGISSSVWVFQHRASIKLGDHDVSFLVQV